jgi:putative sigma-54 modulation protein
MLIHTTARHCELETEVKQFAEQRITRFERFARDIREAHLVVTAEKYRHTAEITLKLNHHDMVSREEATDARGAIDRAADHLDEQLRRLKERRIGRKREGPGAETLAGESSDDDGAQAPSDGMQD